MQDIYQMIGRRIKEYRKQAGLTQQALAERLNCSTSFISRLETGSSMTSVEGLIEISVALQTDVASFFIDFNSYPTDIPQNPRLRSLFYQLNLLSEEQLEYIIKQMELFLSFSKMQRKN